MTTIVAVETPGGVTFASDSRATGAMVNDGWVAKVFQNKGMTFGIAGLLQFSQAVKYAKLPKLPDTDDPEKLDKWVTQTLAPIFKVIDKSITDDDPESRGRSVGLVAVKGRVYQISSRGYWVRNVSGVYAIGSGSPYALGALESGATPKKAIKIASKYDWGTNSDVRILKSPGKA